jgi:hypothetical protein
VEVRYPARLKVALLRPSSTLWVGRTLSVTIHLCNSPQSTGW